jgi:hypothetical protein
MELSTCRAKGSVKIGAKIQTQKTIASIYSFILSNKE